MSIAQSRVSLADGSWVELGSVLAKAGEGTIHALAHRANLVAKIFHPDLADLDQKLDKVAAMVSTPPPGAVQGDGFVVLAWPQQLVYRNGTPVGFLMPRIDLTQAVEIHSMSNPAARANPLPSSPQWTTGATWTHLVTAAANLCLAVDVVHHVNAVIGDFQERNILVTDTVRVALVDCDSMQLTDSAGRQYLSPLGRPEFTAPELAGVDLRNVARDKTSDLFALAVHIHLLIMAGNHPFLRGTWTGQGEQPDALVLARDGHWAGGVGSLLQTHPLAPSVGFLPNEIQELFARAFSEGCQNPNVRPTAEEWRHALTRIRIVSCPREPAHQLPVEADSCPWCDIDAVRTARRTPTRAASTDQVAMPSLTRQTIPRRSPQPAVAHAPAAATKQTLGNRTLPWVLLAIVLLVAVGVLIGFAVSGDDTTEATVTTTRSGSSGPTSVTALPDESSNLQDEVTAPPPPPVVQTSWPLVIIGTCDEGGTCGVKQRSAPYTSAGRLVPTDVYDGDTVTVVCQTTGDMRTNDGHAPSSTWFRLANGAYVAAVYMVSIPAGIPTC